MKLIKIRVAITLLLVWFTTLAWAATDPLTMLQSTSDQVLSALKQNKATLKSNPKAVYDIVNNLLVPHLDLDGMSQAVVGRPWAQATAQQKQQFKEEFKDLLIGTYGSAFANYSNESVKFDPIRGGVQGNRVQVNSNIIRQDGPAIPISYSMILRGQEWRIYDFSVEGISMLQSFRSQFAQDLAQGQLDGLIQRLKQHNQQTNNFHS